MPTTVHIPDELLAKVDARARSMKMARNRYIVEALRKALSEQSEWSPTFLEALEQLEPIDGVDELEAAIGASGDSVRSFAFAGIEEKASARGAMAALRERVAARGVDRRGQRVLR